MRGARSVVPSLAATVAITFLSSCSSGPKTAPPANITVDKSPDRIERGKYLYTTVADCDSCHAEHDYTRLYSPLASPARGTGAVLQFKGLPGRLVASNLTPDPETGIGSWTDGEKIRAIREGISKDGHALDPTMPYPSYRYMSDPDVQSLVAYMDQLPPVRNPLPKTELPAAVLKEIKGVPRPVRDPVPQPNPSNQASTGEYLAAIAYCEECHTPQSGGKPDAARRFAGGQTFATPAGSVVTANITPDKDTGIGAWDYARFRDRLQTFRREYPSVEKLPKIGSDRFTVMHYIAYSGLTEADMAALFAYLQTRTPVMQKVNPHPSFSGGLRRNSRVRTRVS